LGLYEFLLRAQFSYTESICGVPLQNLTITVNRVKGSRSGVQSLDRHKGEPVLDEVLALRSWLKERVEDGSHILFPSQKGGMLTRMQLLRLFRKYALAAGVSPELAHPHILRHTLCSVMASQHADVYAIQRRAGHKNISNTMVYTHISDRQANESAQEALMTAFA
jgi:site-specific recombinase XerD